jgi:hypothetical protein
VTKRDTIKWLRSLGAEPGRRAKHGTYWVLPNGRKALLPGTPSDGRRAFRNFLSDVHKLLKG